MNNQQNPKKKNGMNIMRFLSGILLLGSGTIGCLLFIYFSGNAGNRRGKEITVSRTYITSTEAVNQNADNIEILDNDDGVVIYDSEAETGYDVSEGGIHRYEYYQDDCTWTQAFNKAISMGGYLARINSQEEFEYIVSQMSGSNFGDMIIFHIGGRRDPNMTQYYWIDESNTLYGECLNSPDHWTNGKYWMANEPSFKDSYDNKTVEEDKLVLYKLNGNWALNDSTDGIVEWYPKDSGKVGYIVEFED